MRDFPLAQVTPRGKRTPLNQMRDFPVAQVTPRGKRTPLNQMRDFPLAQTPMGKRTPLNQMRDFPVAQVTPRGKRTPLNQMRDFPLAQSTPLLERPRYASPVQDFPVARSTPLLERPRYASPVQDFPVARVTPQRRRASTPNLRRDALRHLGRGRRPSATPNLRRDALRHLGRGRDQPLERPMYYASPRDPVQAPSPRLDPPVQAPSPRLDPPLPGNVLPYPVPRRTPLPVAREIPRAQVVSIARGKPVKSPSLVPGKVVQVGSPLLRGMKGRVLDDIRQLGVAPSPSPLPVAREIPRAQVVSIARGKPVKSPSLVPGKVVQVGSPLLRGMKGRVMDDIRQLGVEDSPRRKSRSKRRSPKRRSPKNKRRYSNRK